MSDGNWHNAVVERKKRLGSIQVDGEKPVRATADQGATILNSNGKLWIGNFHKPLMTLCSSTFSFYLKAAVPSFHPGYPLPITKRSQDVWIRSK